MELIFLLLFIVFIIKMYSTSSKQYYNMVHENNKLEVLTKYINMEEKIVREEYEEYHNIYKDILDTVEDEETADKIRRIWYKGIIEGIDTGYTNYGKIMIDIMNCNKKEGK